MNCLRCNLHKTRFNVIVGKGLRSARFLFMQESPSISEDLLGKAFVSDSNKILESMIVRAGMSLADCYFTYMVHCRACDDKNDSNRLPTDAEILACMPNVDALLQRIKYQGVIFIDSITTKYYKSKITVPFITLTHPNIIKIKGGTSSNLFIDNTNKLERFYDKIAG